MIAIELNVPTELPPPPPLEQGPIVKYPPFPSMPENVKITPFIEFKPSGIKKFLDPSPDDVEVDGIGIPTAQLHVKHALPGSEKYTKKKKRMGEDDDGVVRRFSWWEEWEKDEANRKTIQMIDPNSNRSDRLIQATQDFRSGRPWPPITNGLQYLFDAFRLYVGLLSQSTPSSQQKKPTPDNDDGMSDEDDLDGEDVYNPIDINAKDRDTKPYAVEEPVVGQKPRPPPADGEEVNEAWLKKRDDANERREARMDAFLNDSATNIAIFFSSHYRDNGLIWSEPRCRDGPLLLTFYLSFLVRNDVFHDSSIQKGLKDALEIVTLAKKELPSTFAIGKSVPDQFSIGCQSLWGSKIRIILLGSTLDKPQEIPEIEMSDPKTQNIDESDSTSAEVATEIKAQIIDFDKVTTEAASTSAGLVKAVEDGAFSNGWGIDTSGGQGQTGWGDSRWDDIAIEEDTTGWAADEQDWNTGATWDTGDTRSLTALLGPTSFPLTHTTGIVEDSTRKIVAVIPPKPRRTTVPITAAEAVEADLEEKFGKMVLAPWIGWDNSDRSDISQPAILPKSRGKIVAAGATAAAAADENAAHDPEKSNIEVLLMPEVIDKLIVGMGLGATWIQIARMDQEGNPVPGGPNIWYLEQLINMIPSYHVDL